MKRTPRTVEEIEAQAGELADWFEDFDSDTATEIPVKEYLLERAARAQAQCVLAVIEAVRDAVASGTTWSRVGEILGMDAIEAHAAYGARSEAATANLTQIEIVEDEGSGLSLDL